MDDNGVTKSCPSILSITGFSTGAMAPGIDTSMDSPPAKVALRKDLRVTNDSAETERHRLLEKLSRHDMEHGQLEKVPLDEDAAKKAMSTSIVHIEKNISYDKNNEKRFGRI